MKKYADQRPILKRYNFKCGDYVRVRCKGLSKKGFRFSKPFKSLNKLNQCPYRYKSNNADCRLHSVGDPVTHKNK
ncbi:hypothetical protein T03_3784 [Trichinella britovi]|uniref:Uncharacterized protein n=1 Tax=Trichinella britovi TaxID=45882 RepID=A0A0V1DIT3_TRIBR|nr:hypothetical protein T03_3784 [Trichinella britovi]